MSWLTILLALLPVLLNLLAQILPLLQKATSLDKLRPLQRKQMASAARLVHQIAAEFTRLGLGPDSPEVGLAEDEG